MQTAHFINSRLRPEGWRVSQPSEYIGLATVLLTGRMECRKIHAGLVVRRPDFENTGLCVAVLFKENSTKQNAWARGHISYKRSDILSSEISLMQVTYHSDSQTDTKGMVSIALVLYHFDRKFSHALRPEKNPPF